METGNQAGGYLNNPGEGGQMAVAWKTCINRDGEQWPDSGKIS